MLNYVAIILQGPILYSEEIVDCYKKVRNNIIISTNYPEVQLTKRFLDLKNSRDDVKFLFPIIYDNEIEVNSIKYNKNLKDFQYDEKFSYDTKKLRFM